MDDEQRGLEALIAAIAADGRAVRQRVGDAVAAAVAQTRSAANGIEEVVRRAANGGVQGAMRASDAAPRQVLRAVVDGVGDGIARAALAARLAFDEARSRGAGFAKRDLQQLAEGFGDAGRTLVAAFGSAAAQAGDERSEQAAGLREHVETTRRQIEPGLRRALDAVTGDPLGLAADAIDAGRSGARAAVGELFDALSGMLAEASKRLQRDEPAGDPQP